MAGRTIESCLDSNHGQRGLELVQRDAMIRVYDHAGNVIETHEHKGDFKEW